MRVTHFALLAAICLLVVLGRPEQTVVTEPEMRQEEEAQYDSSEVFLGEDVLFPVTLEVRSQREEHMADILWLKEASRVALQNGTPYFNIVEQKVSKKFNRKQSMRLSVIEGIIELIDDPMEAEYDAHEVQELVISDFFQ